MVMSSEQQATSLIKGICLGLAFLKTMRMHTKRSLELSQLLKLLQSTVPPVLSHRTRERLQQLKKKLKRMMMRTLKRKKWILLSFA